MNFFWKSTAPIAMHSTDPPNVRPSSGAANEYANSPDDPFGWYSHGQNRNTSSSANPSNPPSKSQIGSRRSARFSALVPGTGQRGSLKTVSTPSILPPSSTSSSRDMALSSASVGSPLSSVMIAPQSTAPHR